MDAEALSILIADLRKLSATKLSAILECLTSEEQDIVLSHLERTTAVTIPFGALAALSPWLVERLSHGTEIAGLWLTHATREALVEIVAASGASAPSSHAGDPSKRPVSLVERVISRRGFGRRAA